jgi:hypothetical protein
VHRPADDSGNAVFVRFGGQPAPHHVNGLVSRAALRLHAYAILASIENGNPGFVSDSYLDSVAVETSLAAIELCTAGLWERAEGGYEVLETETFRVASEVHRQLEELSAHCRASGGHQADPAHPGLCRNCAVRLA